MQRIRSACKRLAACAAAAVLVSAAGGVFPLPVSADDGPVYEYSVLAGGSRIGINVYIRAAGIISNVTVDGVNWEDYDRIEGGGGIVVTLPVKAPEMTKKYAVAYKLDGTDYTVPAVSACDYLKKLKSDSADKYQSVAEAMLNYGYTAETYFSESASLSDYGLEAAPRLGEVPGDPFIGKEAFNQNLEALNMQFRYYGMNLSLLDETQFTLYFETFNEDGESYLTDGQFGGEYVENTNGSAGEGYWKVWRNVPASRLTEVYTYSNLPADPVDFSPLQYLAAAAKSTDTKLAAVCKALYAYGEAVKAVPQDAQKWESDEIRSGTLTEYEGGYTRGHASLDPVDTNMLVTAINLDDYDNARLAGAYLRVYYGGKSVDVLVTDTLKESDGREKGDLDMNIEAFEQLTGASTGVFDVTWQIIPLKDYKTTKLSYKFKQGSNKWHAEIQVRDHTYPVEKAEILYKGNYVTLDKKDYNFFAGDFSEGDGLGAGPYTLKITDIYGQVVEETVDFSLNTEVGSDTIVAGKKQFPA